MANRNPITSRVRLLLGAAMALGVRPVGGTAQELAAFAKAEFDKHGKLIRDGNIKAD
jgi:hypothetical protein